MTWTQFRALETGVSGWIEDLRKAAPTVPADGWQVVYERKKSQGLQNL